mmetsp:Transcript_38440/g.59832  ORF Transcript_38440/g.59832 Transcript_38440/m.59832 type:complete len:208 (-) Transcript_38440:324-947(-)
MPADCPCHHLHLPYPTLAHEESSQSVLAPLEASWQQSQVELSNTCSLPDEPKLANMRKGKRPERHLSGLLMHHVPWQRGTARRCHVAWSPTRTLLRWEPNRVPLIGHPFSPTICPNSHLYASVNEGSRAWLHSSQYNQITPTRLQHPTVRQESIQALLSLASAPSPGRCVDLGARAASIRQGRGDGTCRCATESSHNMALRGRPPPQ